MKKLIVVVLSITATVVQAHQTWIEQDTKSTKLYFGEFGDNLREVSPGLLDKLVQPKASLMSGNEVRPLKVNKANHFYVIEGVVNKNETIIVESQYPVYERKQEGQASVRTAWTPAARYITSSAEQSPKLTLDIVPTGKVGEFKIFFKGKPLTKTKASLVAASGWAKDAWSDEQGIVKFSMPWKGFYAVESHHTETLTGERNGEKYDAASYGTTLSLNQAEGIDPLPAPAQILGKAEK